MTQLYFIRHAQPNFENHKDSERELSPKGRKDCALVTEFLLDKNISAVYSSPFRRAVDTLGEFAALRGLPIRILDDFRQRRVDSGWIEDFTAFSRRQWEDFSYRLSGGECLREVQARNLRALRRVLRECPDASVAVGTHGTALSTLLNAYDPGFGHADFERIKTLMPWAVHFTFFGEECAGIEEINLFTQEVKIRKEVVASYELETL